MQHVCNWKYLHLDATELHLDLRIQQPKQQGRTRSLGSGNEPDQNQDQEEQEDTNNRRRGAKYWMAVGTVAAYATFGSDAVFQVHAQQQDRPAPAVNASGQTQGLTVRRFDIAPGTLDAVIWRPSKRQRSSA